MHIVIEKTSIYIEKNGCYNVMEEEQGKRVKKIWEIAITK